MPISSVPVADAPMLNTFALVEKAPSADLRGDPRAGKERLEPRVTAERDQPVLS